MSWFVAFAGFAALILLHELGHFVAAKAVGMRVERFSLFFPPHFASVKRGETEYAIGMVPLGGYVKITGMSPAEELAPEHAARAYCNQPIWKRIVVIAAGPGVNIVVAFLLAWLFYATVGPPVGSKPVLDAVSKNAAAAQQLKIGDRIVSVDGKSGDTAVLANQINSHRCAGKPTANCVAAKPVVVVVDRAGETFTYRVKPKYDAQNERMRLGFRFTPVRETEPPFTAASSAAQSLWRLTKITVTLPARVFNKEQRSQINGTVGAYEATRQTVIFQGEETIWILALISMSLAIINLFPFLPLDGGHIFWALVEGATKRRVPQAVIERATMLGFALFIGLFVIGFTNDISTLRAGGFGP